MSVSVIIPTFNRAELVCEAVASVLAQDRAADEILVVDDGSSDDTSERLTERFGNRIRILREETNHGVSAARNRGVRASQGDLLAFLDSDDLWLPGKLRTQIEFFETHPDASACQVREIWIRDGRRVNPGLHQVPPSGMIFDACLQRCIVSPSSVMLRRQRFLERGGFDEGLPACEDYDLWLRIAHDTEIHCVSEFLVRRRAGHPDQLSTRHWGMDRFRVAALVKLLAHTQLTPEQRRSTIAVLAQKCAILSDGANRRGRDEEAARYRQLAFLYAPDHSQPFYPNTAVA